MCSAIHRPISNIALFVFLYTGCYWDFTIQILNCKNVLSFKFGRRSSFWWCHLSHARPRGLSRWCGSARLFHLIEHADLNKAAPHYEWWNTMQPKQQPIYKSTSDHIHKCVSWICSTLIQHKFTHKRLNVFLIFLQWSVLNNAWVTW